MEGTAITNFDRKQAGILAAAARVFAAQGFDRCSVRDVAREAGVSVPGLYHYVRSKDELLYLVQLQAFESLVARFTGESRAIAEPEARLALLIRNHLERFLANLAELTVCAREIDRLHGDYQARIEAVRREYFALAVRIFVDLGKKHGTLNVDPRTAALAMFGSINWVSTWYRPGTGLSAASVATSFLRLYLEGLLPRVGGRAAAAPRRAGSARRAQDA
jgi:AcrR family transcriptional regulator